jgi:hypothetical protein
MAQSTFLNCTSCQRRTPKKPRTRFCDSKFHPRFQIPPSLILTHNSFLEGARLRATVDTYRDYQPAIPTQSAASMQDGPEEVNVPVGRRIFVDIILASRDPEAFPDPLEVRLDRPLDSYLQYGWGPHQCVGMDTSRVAMTAMFKTVFGLKNCGEPWEVHRAEGGMARVRGRLRRFRGRAGSRFI